MSRPLARSLFTFLKREDGVTAVECALMLALVVIICFAALKPPTLPPAGESAPLSVEVCTTER